MTVMTRMTGILINCVLRSEGVEGMNSRKESINNCEKCCHSCHLAHAEKGD